MSPDGFSSKLTSVTNSRARRKRRGIVKSVLPWLVGVAGLLAGIAIAVYYGRQALKIANHPAVNVPLPRDLTGRLVYADSAAVRDDIGDLTGRIVTIQGDGGTRKSSERLLVPGPHPPVERITEGLVYESKIDQQASVSAKGTYLVTLSGAFSNSSMLEVTITDVASVRLSDAQIDWPRLRLAAAELHEQAGESSCFVQGVRLAMITYRAYAKSSISNGSAYGDVFAFAGSVYSSSQKRTVDYRVSLDCLALSMVKTVARRTGLAELPEAMREADAISALRALVMNGNITDGRMDGGQLGVLLRLEEN